ncbi:hypothetical protein ACFPJS_13155 [Pedobacter alpinus]
MSECADQEGPQTIVNGKVYDAITNEGYSNIPLQITRERFGFGGSRYEDFDTVVTDNKGEYHLNFTPILPGTFTIYFKDYDLRKYGLLEEYNISSRKELEIGKTNTIDFKVKKLINLKINLKNSSNYNFNTFRLNSASCNCINYQVDSLRITKDTTLNFKVPRLTKIFATSMFYNKGTNSFKKNEHIYDILGTDTTVVINN